MVPRGVLKDLFAFPDFLSSSKVSDPALWCNAIDAYKTAQLSHSYAYDLTPVAI